MALRIGDPTPWFRVASSTRPTFHFESVAGRYVVLCFFRSAGDAIAQAVLEKLKRHYDIFDDLNRCFFGVSIDPQDLALHRVQEFLPGIRFFWDFDQNLSQYFGLITGETTEKIYNRCSYILDERLRVIAVLPFQEDPEAHVSQLVNLLAQLPDLGSEKPAQPQAPVLVIPRIFEPELCQELIDYYEFHGGNPSGFMKEVNGHTIGVQDLTFKRRSDREISDQTLKGAAMFRIHDRLAPEILKAFQFRATRIERHMVACYDAETGGFFRAHRDNTTKGTAHRRFAVSLNLNTGDYEGGQLRFPEFGRQTYEAPPGGAVVFSCSLLHEATPITRGKRYAYLPFLYDEAAAKIREANRSFVTPGLQAATVVP